ncbi:hypothetical protein PVAND_016489 [Polypedilum vanderplanki]|uniref:Farnesoic acid O-methyl transferase domain-containing protein n=1 Tax=Polypedilum vanderplanki TaxID=319348 RepID=A0A9J6BG28_POLVA|nr:hypothetical protein PVAND_016489 [Polypedilum vanderplanki]
MKLIIFIILALISSLTFAQEPFISCDYFDYFVNNTEVYACHLRIQNPNGIEFNEIIGEHRESMTNNDVVALIPLIGSTTIVPQIICSQFLNLEILDLSFLSITTITATSFSGCQNITWLRLYYNHVPSMPGNTFANNPRLTFIDMDNLGLTSIPENLFSNLVNLEELELSGNHFSTLPSGLFRGLTRLHTLYLSSLGLTEFDEEIFADLESLTYLTLFNNLLTNISERSFENLRLLEILDLGNNQIGEQMPNGIFANLNNLITLSLVNIGVRNLRQEWFNNLRNLHQLSLARNNIDQLPSGVFNGLVNIERISFWQNRIKTIDREAFGSVNTLRYLDLDMNVVNSMDQRLFNDSVNLQSLYFSNNLCASGYFFNFHLNRENFIQRLGRCFRNYGFTVDTDTESNEPYQFFNAPTPGIQLRVTSNEEVQLAFTPFNFPWTPMLEIFIGAANNTRSIIRRNQEDEVVVVPTPGILRDGEMNGFRITWANHILLAFREGEEFPFLAFTMSDFFNVNFYGLRSPTTRATWSIQPIDRENLQTTL